MHDSPPGPSDERIEENTVAWLADRKVTISNIWQRTYQRADGTQATGPAGVIGVSDGGQVAEIVVGVGSRVEVGDAVYEVVAIDAGEKDPDQTGHIVLRPVPAPPAPAGRP
jgi:hypothetical protein